MCGLVGWLPHPGRAGAELDTSIERMAGTLRHRGPDDGGTWTDHDARVALGHRRLAIIDLSPAGCQPMASPDGRYIVALNGEIYNHRELRPELEAAGLPFRGHSDTEVLVAALQHRGIAATLPGLIGMYAIAIWDRRERALTLVRDRLGEKPLYYGWNAAGFLFASELKALAASPAWQPEVDRDALASYLRHGYIPAPHSIYRGIAKLPPGTSLRLSDRSDTTVTPEAYWSAGAVALAGLAAPERHAGREGEDDGERDATTALDTLLRETVRDKMVADVPLGAFLSGGIDSSTITAVMQAESSRPVRTFSIGFREAGYDESGYARQVAAHLGTEHTEFFVTPEEARAVIPALPAMYDEPFADSSQIPTHLICRLARQDVTVALSGDGGDELFGGYNRYFIARRLWGPTARLTRPLQRLAGGVIRATAPERLDRWYGRIAPLLPARARFTQMGDKLHKLAALADCADEDAAYWRLISQFAAPENSLIAGVEPDIRARHREVLAQIPDFSERMMYLDLVTYLPDDILVKVDRASMAVSLEVRVPFLDHRIVEFAWRQPLAAKLGRGGGKLLLRRVLQRYLPGSLIDRPKMGFGVPLGQWLRGPLAEWADSLLTEEALRRTGVFDVGAIRGLWLGLRDHDRNLHYQVWTVLMYQAWALENGLA